MVPTQRAHYQKEHLVADMSKLPAPLYLYSQFILCSFDEPKAISEDAEYELPHGQSGVPMPTKTSSEYSWSAPAWAMTHTPAFES